MVENKYYFFKKEQCDLCGLCLHKCPVLELPLEEAKEEMRKLIEGEKAKHIIKKCTSCMTCNLICPNNCNPYELILYRWYEKYKEKGLANISRFILTPLQPKPNLWSILKERVPEDEKQLYTSWSELTKCEEFLYPGCSMCGGAFFLFKSKLFEDQNIMMTDELCCAEPFYRLGVFDTAEQTAKRLEKQFKEIGVKKILFPCLGCYDTILKIYPDKFNVKYDFEATGLLDFLSERIENGNIKIRNKVNKKLTLHDNCHAKPFGTHYFDLSRKILQTCGVEIVEMKHNKQNALCCGIASFARKQDIMDIVMDAQVRLKEAEESGAEGLVVYCGGCFLILSLAKVTLESKIPIYFITEIIQEAIGETPFHRIEERAGVGFKIAMEEGPKHIADLPKRYKMKSISPDIETKIE